ncbi:septal ring lytic transglycosylase RlpA family protein [Methylobacterium organophilum]|uniref:Endolytic peptidoglycan transglycosylase RlpA n=1 Tax=Methylobacterium organophilum TaxID=410 RepID=A0ABQ4T3K8_METOR|nr:septal ring lytic transglycosylase RlpA family protein [Methylobacterium organophilum]GJE26236.1 Endolytic peptidoglycan transglycosylase RlpA [Methylobacterium organophilum]
MILHRLALRAGIACALLATSPALAETASWYGPGFHGRRTASGERFDQNAMTAAHRSLPLGSLARVTDSKTGRSIVVRVTDRGPAAWTGRAIDLSRGAALALGILSRGTASVRISPL